MNTEHIDNQDLTAIGEDLFAATKRSAARSRRRSRVAKVSALSISALALTASAGMAATGTTPGDIVIHVFDDGTAQIDNVPANIPAGGIKLKDGSTITKDGSTVMLTTPNPSGEAKSATDVPPVVESQNLKNETGVTVEKAEK